MSHRLGLPVDSSALKALHEALHRIHPLSEQAWCDVAACAVSRPLAAGQLLLRAGEMAKRVFFVHSGLLREYYVDHEGRGATRRFCSAGEFSGSLADLLAQGPSAVFIECMQDCALLEMDWQAVDALSLRHPSLMHLMRRFAEGLYIHKMQREFEMLTLPAAERYRLFASRHTALNAQLPRHMVASYLGITPVHLSRIGAGPKSPRSTTRPPKKT